MRNYFKRCGKRQLALRGTGRWEHVWPGTPHLHLSSNSGSEEELREVLLSIANTDISPELLPPDKQGKIAQKTEDLVGPYELHDYFIYYTVKYGLSPVELLKLATASFSGVYDGKTIKGWLRVFIKRFFSQQFKRSCMPDGVKVTEISLSPRGSFAMPSDMKCALWLEELG
jgi:NAD+ synthase (glutamine-hydrolysing)